MTHRHGHLSVRREHNYDVPMIIAEDRDESSPYWKGIVTAGDALLAQELAGSRLVACAQVAQDGSIALKTTSRAKDAVTRMVPEITWTPINGNTPYLDWLDAETHVAASQQSSTCSN